MKKNIMLLVLATLLFSSCTTLDYTISKDFNEEEFKKSTIVLDEIAIAGHYLCLNDYYYRNAVWYNDIFGAVYWLKYTVSKQNDQTVVRVTSEAVHASKVVKFKQKAHTILGTEYVKPVKPKTYMVEEKSFSSEKKSSYGPLDSYERVYK